MANKDITESGVQEVLRTMGIPSSFKGFREDVTGRAEALATVGSGMAGTMAGMGGGMIEMLRSGNPQAALDQYRQIQEAMTFVPRTQGGLERVQQIGEFLEPVANIYEQFGEGVAEQTGSPVVGEFAQEFVDPLDLMGLGAVSAIPAIARKSRFAENVASQTTQRANTVGTAVKAANYLDEIGAKGKTLDYGAGLGENAKAINADETFEPFPQGEFNPTYTDPAQVPANAYGRIVSTNVLNVLPPDIRQEAVLTIGKALEPDGTALIQTWDVGAAKAGMKSKKAIPAEGEENAYTTSTGSYQKGFSKQELQEYIAETLGPGFLVEPVPGKAGISGSSVTIKKIADPSIELDLGLPQAQMNEIAQQYIKAYHGSPADFDKFMLEFIGTGEGAQAYGWGLYFAQLRGVAEDYKEALTAPRVLLDNKPLGDVYTADIRESFKGFYNGIIDRQIEEYADMFADAAFDLGLNDADAHAAAMDYLEAAKDQLLSLRENQTINSRVITSLKTLKNEFPGVGLDEQMFFDLEDTINDIDSIIANLGQGGGNRDDFNFILKNYLKPRQQALYEEYFADKIKFDEPEGRVYEVDIAANEDELLDWDKPFKEQPKKVQDALRKALGAEDAKTDYRSMTREELQDLGQRLDPKGVWTDEQNMIEFGDIPTREDLLETIEGMDVDNDISSYMGTTIDESEPGRTLYERLIAQRGGGDRLENAGEGPRRASEALKELGLKGIKYADGLSRNKEGGTSNFVIFDPRIIKIAKKYGVAVPVAGMILMQIEKELEKQTEQAPVA